VKKLLVLAFGLFSMFGASSAFAVTCTTTNLTGPTGYSGWPYAANVLGCSGTTLDNLKTVQGGLYDMVHNWTVGSTGKGPALKTLAPDVFYFNTPADYASYMTGCPALPAHVFGYTFWSPLTCTKTSNQPYSVVLDQSSDAESNAWLDNTAAHEMGHWFDEKVLNTGSTPFSSGTLWTHVMMGSGGMGDYPNFTGLGAPCSGVYHPFAGREDNHVPHMYICDNSGSGPDLSSTAPLVPPNPHHYNFYTANLDIINAAVPMFFSDPAELFAEEAAYWTGAVTSRPYIDAYLGQGFEWYCTKQVVLSELQYAETPGPYPKHYQVPAGCPAN